MENKVKIEVDLKEIENAIFGTTTKNFKYVDLNNWKNLARKELSKLIKALNGEYGERESYKVLEYIDYKLLEDIINLLGNINFVENGDVFEIDNEIVDVCVAETIYNFYIQKSCSNETTKNLLLFSQEKKLERIKEFLDLAREQKIIVKIFKNEREIIDYLFVEGKDTEQLIDGIQSIIENGFDFEKQNNILKIHDNMYVYILY